MAKSYLSDAREHYERIQYYYKEGGVYGHSQASNHYSELGKCYQKSAANRSGEAAALGIMYEQAGELMKIMKRREEGKPDTDEDGK